MISTTINVYRLRQVLQHEERVEDLHVVKVSTTTATNIDQDEQDLEDFLPAPPIASNVKLNVVSSGNNTMRKRAAYHPLVIEMAVFFDKAAYQSFMQFYHDSAEVLELILEIVNGIQGVYNYPSLGRKVTIGIVYIEIQKNSLFDNAGGEREQMLKNFCAYQQESMLKPDPGVNNFIFYI
jgi:hypothetical protein